MFWSPLQGMWDKDCLRSLGLSSMQLLLVEAIIITQHSPSGLNAI
jgi:hypothetical protein